MKTRGLNPSCVALKAKRARSGGAPDAPRSLCTYCHALSAPGMQAGFDLSPLFTGAPIMATRLVSPSVVIRCRSVLDRRARRQAAGDHRALAPPHDDLPGARDLFQIGTAKALQADMHDLVRDIGPHLALAAVPPAMAEREILRQAHAVDVEHVECADQPVEVLGERGGGLRLGVGDARHRLVHGVDAAARNEEDAGAAGLDLDESRSASRAAG